MYFTLATIKILNTHAKVFLIQVQVLLGESI